VLPIRWLWLLEDLEVLKHHWRYRTVSKLKQVAVAFGSTVGDQTTTNVS
jgi:hypothetical protein